MSECVLQECLNDYNLSQYPPSIASLGTLCVSWHHILSSSPTAQREQIMSAACGPEIIITDCVHLCSKAGLSQQGVATLFNLCVTDLTVRQDILNAIPWQSWIVDS